MEGSDMQQHATKHAAALAASPIELDDLFAVEDFRSPLPQPPDAQWPSLAVEGSNHERACSGGRCSRQEALHLAPPVRSLARNQGGRAMSGRGKAQKSLDLIDAAYEILEEIEPATVRAVCYRLFVAGAITSMQKSETNKVSKQLTWAHPPGDGPRKSRCEKHRPAGYWLLAPSEAGTERRVQASKWSRSMSLSRARRSVLWAPSTRRSSRPTRRTTRPMSPRRTRWSRVRRARHAKRRSASTRARSLASCSPRPPRAAAA